MLLSRLSSQICTILLVPIGLLPLSAQAQIIPDQTLGSETSNIVNDQLIRGDRADLIEDGATRGDNLFHSFSEFNVNSGQRVYFFNPVGIESILSRVTGENPSAINGTLGVDGPASLFLINPNGLVFGEAAVLDVTGSFYGTTAEAVTIGNGVFSAVDPGQSQLLAVSPSISFWNYLTDTSGEVVNRGALAIGGDLILAGNRLDLQGQVAAAGDVSLLATDTVQIRDTAEVPFIGFAGGDLLVQGNQQVDIVALSHPESGLFSNGNMVLRSASQVGGDAHYLSGGDFRIEQLDGSNGELFSPIDPIIRALGDVTIGAYIGGSLHIIAGGSVRIDAVIINAVDPGSLSIDFLQENIELSDGTVVSIDGGTQPTLDVRAGVLPESIGNPPLEMVTGLNPLTDSLFMLDLTDSPSNANIEIGDVFIDASDGLVLLTNQYSPNTLLNGDILIETRQLDFGGVVAGDLSTVGGQIIFDSRNNINVVDSLIATSSVNLDGGGITLLAENDIALESPQNKITGLLSTIPPDVTSMGGSIRINAQNLELRDGSAISTEIFGNGPAGNVILNIEGAASFDGVNLVTGAIGGISSVIRPGSSGLGGKIELTASNLEVTNGAQLNASTFGEGNAGNVILNISETARFDGVDAVTGIFSGAGSSVLLGGVGRGGNVEVNARNLEVANGAQLIASTFNEGDAGSVLLNIEETARFSGVDAVTGAVSGAGSGVEADGIGRGGNVEVNARDLQVTGGALLFTSTAGEGDSGNVILNIEETARFEGVSSVTGVGGGVRSSVEPSGIGRGGNIEVTAGNLDVTNGAQLLASTFGQGNAGNVVLDIEETANFDGINPLTGLSPTGVGSNIELGGIGRGGNIEVTAGNLNVTNGAQLLASTFGQGNAGNVVLDIRETARFDGVDAVNGIVSGTGSSVEAEGVGRGGDIELTARNLEVSNGAQLLASTFGEGDAGNVILNIEEISRFDGVSPVTGIGSGARSSVEIGGVGRGGNVEVTTRNLEVSNGAQLLASTFGEGDAGIVMLDIEETARFDGVNPATGINPTSAASSVEQGGVGRGGNVELAARNLEVTNGAQISASTLGEGDAGNVILDIEETARFDGVNPVTGINPAGAASTVEQGGVGRGGNVKVTARNLEVTNGAQLSSETSGEGDAGNVILEIEETAHFDGVNPITGFSPSAARSSVASGSVGHGGNIEVAARNLNVTNGALLLASTFGEGDAGNVILEIERMARVDGVNLITGLNVSTVGSSVETDGVGRGGDVELTARNLEVTNGAMLSAATFGEGDAGNIILDIEETARFDGVSPITGSNSSAVGSSVEIGGIGRGGNVELTARNLEVTNGALLTAATFGEGDAGNIILDVEETARFDGMNPITGAVSPTSATSLVFLGATGNGGDIEVTATNLELTNGGILATSSFGEGDAGDIVLIIRDRIQLQDGIIATNAEFNAGGQIQIEAGNIFLFGDGDIQTFVNSGANNGGNITINANALVAFDDSDILAFAADGRGGDVDLSQTAFFGQDFSFAPPGTDPRTLEGNDRVDINATGRLASGTITLADVSFIQDSLTELPDNLVNPEALVANSCIARRRDTDSNLVITGSDGLPVQPNRLQASYELGEIRSFTEPSSAEAHSPITEPHSTYRLADGRLVLGRECEPDH